jgi:hypothetical protein
MQAAFGFAAPGLGLDFPTQLHIPDAFQFRAHEQGCGWACAEFFRSEHDKWLAFRRCRLSSDRADRACDDDGYGDLPN